MLILEGDDSRDDSRARASVRTEVSAGTCLVFEDNNEEGGALLIEDEEDGGGMGRLRGGRGWDEGV